MNNFNECILAWVMLSIGVPVMQQELFAGNGNYPTGAQASGMGGASVCLTSVWANFFNQANLAGLEKTSIGVHHQTDYGIHQLSTSAISFAKPVGEGTLGLCTSFFGYTAYRETKTGLSYARKLSGKISAGIQLEYLCSRASDNSQKNRAFTFELGLLAELSRELKLGIHIFNPANVHFNSRKGELIPPMGTLGLGYKPVQSLLISIQTEEKLGYSPMFRGGIEFELARSIFLRTGISSIPWENSFGAGFKLKSILIDLSLRRNPILGYSPACSISYKFP